MAAERTEFSFEGPAAFEEEARRERVAGLGPWRLALRRLRRNRVALAFGAVFLVVVALCLAAPIWADRAGTDPFKNHLTDQVTVDGKKKDVVTPDGVPIGPTWQSHFFLGADTNGRDTAVRLLYGGRNSLLIGISAAPITTLFPPFLGNLSRDMRGLLGGGISPVVGGGLGLPG